MQAVDTDRGQLEINSSSIIKHLFIDCSENSLVKYDDVKKAKKTEPLRSTKRLHTIQIEVRTDAVGSCNGPNQSHAKHPEYAEYSERITSFPGWPSHFPHQSPERMALEGFFFLGTLDRVRCFYCGITLREWEEEDDPYEAHLEWSEECAFIKGRRDSRNKEQRRAALLEKARDFTFFTSQTRTSGASTSATITNEPGTSTTSSVTSARYESTATMAEEEEAVARSSSPTSEIRSAKIEAVLEMGCSVEAIERAIELRRQSGRGEFLNAVELFEAVLELEKLDSSE